MITCSLYCLHNSKHSQNLKSLSHTQHIHSILVGRTTRSKPIPPTRPQPGTESLGTRLQSSFRFQGKKGKKREWGGGGEALKPFLKVYTQHFWNIFSSCLQLFIFSLLVLEFWNFNGTLSWTGNWWDSHERTLALKIHHFVACSTHLMSIITWCVACTQCHFLGAS